MPEVSTAAAQDRSDGPARVAARTTTPASSPFGLAAGAGNLAISRMVAIQRDKASDISACQAVLMGGKSTDLLWAVGDFSVVDTSDRIGLVRKVLDCFYVNSKDEQVLAALWKSPGMAEEAAGHQDIYAKSIKRGAPLPASPGTFGTFTNTVTQNMTEGATTVVKGRFNWTLLDWKLQVDIPCSFKPDAGITVPLATWQSQLDTIWNKYAVIDKSDGKKVPITLTLRNVDGDARQIKVVQNTVPGSYAHPDRANAAKWYPVMPDTTAPHEVGHLVGLPDEYQRTHADFKAITGQDKPGPANLSGQDEKAIAGDLHTALTNADATKRAGLATAVLQNVVLINTSGAPVQGDMAQKVMEEYDKAYPAAKLLPALQGLPSGTNWTLLSVFSYASSTVMGNPQVFGDDPHAHPVEDRHLREFLNIVKAFYPARAWEIGPK